MEKKILFIFGCQRSGTTATINGLEKMEDFKIFREVNDQIHKREKGKYNIRIKPTAELLPIFNQLKERVVVVKPLVESQHALNLLEDFPNSNGLWMFRNHAEVVKSMIKKWGPDVGKTMLRVIKNDKTGNWRSEKTDHVKELVSSINIKRMSSESAASLFWYIRNSFYFKQKLYNNERILLCSYQRLIDQKNYLTELLSHFEYMEKNRLTDFYKRVTEQENSGMQLINPYIKHMCDGQYERLINLENYQSTNLTLRSVAQ